MGRNKRYVDARLPYEIPCYGIAVAYDEAVMSKVLSTDEKDIAEVHAYLDRLVAPTKDYGAVLGVNNGPKGILVLVRVADDGSDKTAVRELLSKYEDMGCRCKLAKDVVFADGRYLQGPYEGFLVKLPDWEVDSEIRRIMDTYCHSWDVSQDPKLGLIFYEGDLGGRAVSVCLQDGDTQLGAGIVGGQMHCTRDVRRYWKQVLRGFEDDIIAWAEEHQGMAKKVFRA